MKTSAIGDEYENFANGRVFLVQGDRCVTIKVYGTWEGRITQLKSGICVSWRSGRPMAYRFGGFGAKNRIKNVTYNLLETEFNWLFNKVACRTTKSKHQCNAIKRKFVTLCSQVSLSKCTSLTALQAEILKNWFPLLAAYDEENVLEFTQILDQHQIRYGFRKKSLTEAVETWFKKSPKELVERIKQLLSPNQETLQLSQKLKQLPLLIACRKWHLKDLYALNDFNTHCYFPLDIKKTERLLTTYNPQQWLSIFERDSLGYQQFFLFNRLIDLFAELSYQDSILPQNPLSVNEIHRTLTEIRNPPQCQLFEAPYCRCGSPPVVLMLDCPVCGKEYPSGDRQALSQKAPDLRDRDAQDQDGDF